jgi:hypothetical protein
LLCKTKRDASLRKGRNICDAINFITTGSSPGSGPLKGAR